MKHLILTLLIGCTGLLTFSQTNDWAPVGAKWVYNYIYCNTDPYCGYAIFESIGDTTILGKTCRKVRREEVLLDSNDTFWATGSSFYSDSILFIYEDSGQVNVYDKVNSEFFTLYDFSLGAGDSLIIADTLTSRGFVGAHCNPAWPEKNVRFCYPIAYKIERDTQVMINGTSHYAQIPARDASYQGKQSGLGFGENFLLVEGIGATGPNLFGYDPNSLLLYPMAPGRLLCYTIKDSVVWNDPGVDCLNLTTVATKEQKSSTVEVFPNPSSGNLSVRLKGNERIKEVMVVNNLGQQILQKNFSCEQSVILDVSTWVNGWYAVMIHTCEGNHYKTLITKN